MHVPGPLALRRLPEMGPATLSGKKPERLRIDLADMVRWVRFSEKFEPIATLVEPAWTDADAMSVLADWMMGNVDEVASSIALHRENKGDHLRPDHELFNIEAGVRDWLVKQIFGEVQIRHTGGWPRVTFCVTHARREGDFPRLKLKRLRSIFPTAVENQPRLLFIEHECPKRCDGECCNELRFGILWTCITCGAYS